jgi:serine/threonine-protein kinase RsbW
MSNQIESKILIKSLPENLSLVEQYIEDVCTELNIGHEVFGNILITTTEAVNNAILHGNSRDVNKNVEVSYKYDTDSKRISFVVSDEGNGFDYTNVPDPTSPENVLMLGGRGVFLMKQLADFVIFSNNGNTVELEFKL